MRLNPFRPRPRVAHAPSPPYQTLHDALWTYPALYDTQKPPVPLGVIKADGSVERFRPARHVAPPTIQRVIQRFSRLWTKQEGQPPAEQTTEQGAASAASPSTYEFSLYPLRYEQRALIGDMEQMLTDCPRARRAHWMYAEEAVRQEIQITLDEKALRGPTAPMYRRAEAIAKRICAIYNPMRVSLAYSLVADGNLYVQHILAGSEYVNAKKMPAAGMERNSDDTDEFPDPEHAYSQVDTATNQEHTTWPEAFISHIRWRHINGTRYGTPEAVAGRRHRRLLELQEDAQAVRRQTRAARKLLWQLGTQEIVATEKEIADFMRVNGMVKGAANPFNPMNSATDIFGTATTNVVAIPGDSDIDKIEDLRYGQEVYMMAQPTPASLMNLNADAVNRDVLEEQYAQWLKATQILTSKMQTLIDEAYQVALLAANILPAAIKYTISIAPSQSESPADRTTRVCELVNTGLISLECALTMLSEDLPFSPEEILRQKEQEATQQQERALALQKEQNRLGMQTAEHSAELERENTEHEARTQARFAPQDKASMLGFKATQQQRHGTQKALFHY